MAARPDDVVVARVLASSLKQTPASESPVPVIAIVGETASGKSALALDLAQRFDGEIICADSRTVYRGMDIGTAKPSAAERALVTHYLLDVVDPDEHFTAAQFKRLAEAAIADITARGKLPFIVGGTGLYVDAIMYDFSFLPPADAAVRAEFEQKTVEELQDMLIERGLPLPANARNPRHLVRALETGCARPARSPLRPGGLMLGRQIDRDELKANIVRRVDRMLAAGLIHEVKHLADRYGWDAPGLRAPGYHTFRLFLSGDEDEAAAKQRLIQEHVHLAKRQRTWFKRNSDIHYLSKNAEYVDLITSHLNNCYTASD